MRRSNPAPESPLRIVLVGSLSVLASFGALLGLTATYMVIVWALGLTPP